MPRKAEVGVVWTAKQSKVRRNPSQASKMTRLIMDAGVVYNQYKNN